MWQPCNCDLLLPSRNVYLEDFIGTTQQLYYILYIIYIIYDILYIHTRDTIHLHTYIQTIDIILRIPGLYKANRSISCYGLSHCTVVLGPTTSTTVREWKL